MKKFILFVLLFLSTDSLRAADTDYVQVPVPMECRVPNFVGQCVWSSLSLCGKYQKIDAAKDLHKIYFHGTGPNEVINVLNARGITYEMTLPGNKDVNFLKKHIAAGRPLCVTWSSVHMLNLVHYKDGFVSIIDNADRSLAIKCYREEDFLRMWDGWAIALLPEMPIPQAK